MVETLRHDSLSDPPRERRKYVRLNLRLKSFISASAGTAPVETLLENISVAGFFYLSPKALEAGQQLDCLFVFPEKGDTLSSLVMEAHALVVRVVPNGNSPGLYGIGCRIEDYRIRSLDKTLLESRTAAAYQSM